MKHRIRVAASLTLALAVVAGACGGDDDAVDGDDATAQGDDATTDTSTEATTDQSEGDSAGQGENTSGGEASGDVKLFHRWTDTHQAAIEKGFDDCNAKLPDINLEYSNVSSAEYEVQLPISLSSDSPPDIYALWPGGRPIFQSKNGLIAPITDFYQNKIAPLYTDGVDDGVVESDGEIYVMPFNVLPNAFYYRTDKFAEYGLEAPATWDEFVQVLTTLKENGETPIALGSSQGWEPLFWFDYMVLRIAGPEFRERLMSGEESYTDPLVIEAMQKWGELIDAGFFNEDITSIGWDEMGPLVADGTATMMLMGPWAIDSLEGAGLAPGVDFDMFPFPTIDPAIPDATEGAMEGWAVTGYNDNASAVEAVLECIASTEELTNYATEFPSLTPNDAVSIDVYPEASQPILERLQDLTSASFHQNLELATSPPVTDVAKREIPRFLTFPDQYERVLEALDTVSKAEFGG